MKNTARTRTKSARPKTPTTLPAIAAAVARLADPDAVGINTEFLRAWAQMPEVFQAHLVGEESSIDRITWFGVLDQIIKEDIDSSRHADDSYSRRFAEYHDLLENVHPDARGIVTTPYVTASFQIGIAFACYVLASGGAR